MSPIGQPRIPVFNPSYISQVVPGGGGLTRSASNIIGSMLQGMPSTSVARRSNAYFGSASGMPSSNFIKGRGFDIYSQQAEQQKQKGLENLMQYISGVTQPELQAYQIGTQSDIEREKLAEAHRKNLADYAIAKQEAASHARDVMGRTWNLEHAGEFPSVSYK